MTDGNLETERLYLRRITLDDADLMLAIWNDPSFVRNVGDRGIHTIEAARDAVGRIGLPCVVRPSFTLGGSGSSIAFNRDEAKLTIRGVPDQPGVAYKIVGPVGEANIEVDMIVQNIANDGTTDFTFTVNRSDYAKAVEILNRVSSDVGAREVVGDDKIVKISVLKGNGPFDAVLEHRCAGLG
mgnify:CR=1 FL=1